MHNNMVGKSVLDASQENRSQSQSHCCHEQGLLGGVSHDDSISGAESTRGLRCPGLCPSRPIRPPRFLTFARNDSPRTRSSGQSNAFLQRTHVDIDARTNCSFRLFGLRSHTNGFKKNGPRPLHLFGCIELSVAQVPEDGRRLKKAQKHDCKGVCVKI
jgi:hypothetical protein